MKRSVDICGAVLALVISLPLLTVVAILIAGNLGRPVLFRQRRPGLSGRPFRMVKFRTMTDRATADGSLLPDHLRMTRLGRWLRDWSLDELPELWNVLKGDMSLVGPRPLLTEYLALYSAVQARRHEVRPGITGWAQVNGRNGVSWEDRFAMDVWYVDHHSFWLDIRIMWMTVRRVITREGVSEPGVATMSKFTGFPS